MSAIPFSPTVAASAPSAPRWRWLPAPNTWKYHALLLALGILVLGPLGGLTASYMNFSIGFFVGGQVLAGLLGSTVTFGYGAEGKHGANFIQTAAASVASMSALGVLIQAMVWLGLPQPPMWQLVLYMLTIGMFGAGIGMLYTPILVDRMQLVFPSGLAVANILRALTDPVLLRRSVGLLASGVATGLVGGVGAAKIALLGTIELSTSTFGAGMVVGARIGLATIVGGLVGVILKPYFLSIGWLQPGDPARKIMFLIALGWIMGAAIVDMALISYRAVKRWRVEIELGAFGRARADPAQRALGGVDVPHHRPERRNLPALAGAYRGRHRVVKPHFLLAPQHRRRRILPQPVAEADQRGDRMASSKKREMSGCRVRPITRFSVRNSVARLRML